MPDVDPGEACPLCKHRHMTQGTIDLTFHQMTDRGRVTCRVALPRSICPHCGFDALGAEAEAIMDQAVREEYGKLPPLRSTRAVSDANTGDGAKGSGLLAEFAAMVTDVCRPGSAPWLAQQRRPARASGHG